MEAEGLRWCGLACKTKPSPDNQRKQEEEITIQPVHTQPEQPCKNTRESRKGLEGNPCLSIEDWRGTSKRRRLLLAPIIHTGKVRPHLRCRTLGHGSLLMKESHTRAEAPHG